MRVAYLGLGAMGRPMAGKIAESFSTTVWNRTSSVAIEHAAATGSTAITALDELRDVDVVCTCLPTDSEVAEVASRVLPQLARDTIWLDHTSGDPAGSRALAERMATHGVIYLDAPVSGGPVGAADGALTVMVGGSTDALERARPVLEAVAGRIHRVGPVGSGMAVKAVNNALMATSLWAAAEGMVALTKAGVDPAAALEVIGTSSGRSFVTQTFMPERIMTRDFRKTFGLPLLAKDVHLAAAVLTDSAVDGQVLALIDRLTSAAAASLGDVGHLDIVRLVEDAAGAQIRPPA